jgi:hypothetical protein
MERMRGQVTAPPSYDNPQAGATVSSSVLSGLSREEENPNLSLRSSRMANFSVKLHYAGERDSYWDLVAAPDEG